MEVSTPHVYCNISRCKHVQCSASHSPQCTQYSHVQCCLCTTSLQRVSLSCCRFGTEHEKLGYNLSDHKRIDYNSIKALLEGLCSRFGWEPIMEGQYIIGAVLDGQSVTIEPGGQFELSGAPVDTLHKTCSEVNSHLYQVCTDEKFVCFLQVAHACIMHMLHISILTQYACFLQLVA